MRTTRADLDALVRIINNATNGGNGDYFIQYAYGRPRLFRDSGAIEVSPRLPTGELALWLRAFIAGMSAFRN